MFAHEYSWFDEELLDQLEQHLPRPGKPLVELEKLELGRSETMDDHSVLHAFAAKARFVIEGEKVDDHSVRQAFAAKAR